MLYQACKCSLMIKKFTSGLSVNLMRTTCSRFTALQYACSKNSDEVLRILSMLTGAEGRFDYTVSKTNIIGIVDYAHTPDALENVLATIKKLRKGYEQIITVVGCGGNRDKNKTTCNGAARM